MRRARSCVVTAGSVCAVWAVAFVLCMAGMLAVNAVYEHYYPSPTVPSPEQITVPLPAEVVQDLCTGLELPADCETCRPGAVVYAPEFYRAIRNRFRPGVATRQEIDRVLGPYRLRCLPPHQYRGGTFIDCSYDLLGHDTAYEFCLVFRDDGALDRIMFGGPGN